MSLTSRALLWLLCLSEWTLSGSGRLLCGAGQLYFSPSYFSPHAPAVLSDLQSWLLHCVGGSAVSCPPQPLRSSRTKVLGWAWVSFRVNERSGAAEQWVLVTLGGTESLASAHGGLADIWQGSAVVPPQGSADCLQPTGGLCYVATLWLMGGRVFISWS